MPSSRSAKEICRDFGEKDVACKIARRREKRKKEREAEEGKTEAETPEEVETPADPVKERDKYIEDIVSGSQTGKT